MKTGHSEIMNTLVSLCKPSPDSSRTIHFDPSRSRMLELYGTAVDHPDFHNAFTVVVSAGGCGSPALQEMMDFTAAFVNPKLRQLRFEVYSVVAPFHEHHVRLKIAMIKWAWSQKPVRGFCPVPPAIAFIGFARAPVLFSLGLPARPALVSSVSFMGFFGCVSCIGMHPKQITMY